MANDTLGQTRGLWDLVEPCCGSAALAYHLIGAKALLPYQGSKWKWRRELETVVRELNFQGEPRALHLSDPSPWPAVHGQVLDPTRRGAVLKRLRQMNTHDPREVFHALQGEPVPSTGQWAADYVAEYLFLQRLSFRGKAVGVIDGCWRSPGFSSSSAYGTPGSARFSEVKPQVPAMIRRLEDCRAPLDVLVYSAQRRAGPPAAAHVGPRPTCRTLVYVDPPYKSTTKYPDGDLSRAEVVRHALAYREQGCAVIVSEAEPLDLPGWKTKRLGQRGPGDDSPFKGKHSEWVTYAG